MDLQITTESFSTASWTWLGSKFGVDTAKPVTMKLSLFDEDTHYPNGVIKSGTILAHYTSGANDGFWGPYIEDDASGGQVAAGILLDGGRVRRKVDGTLMSTVTVGACLLAGMPIQIVVSKLPGLLLDDGTTAYAPLAADLPSGFIALDLM